MLTYLGFPNQGREEGRDPLELFQEKDAVEETERRATFRRNRERRPTPKLVFLEDPPRALALLLVFTT